MLVEPAAKVLNWNFRAEVPEFLFEPPNAVRVEPMTLGKKLPQRLRARAVTLRSQSRKCAEKTDTWDFPFLALRVNA